MEMVVHPRRFVNSTERCKQGTDNFLGLATMCVGIIALLVLPDYPATTRWLSEEEKIIAQGRLAADAGSDDILGEDNVSIWTGIVWAVKDYTSSQP
jgi:hypothetical protein